MTNFGRMACCAAAIVGAATSLPVRAESVADFYGNNTLTFIIATNPGGGYDLYSRTLGTFMAPHIPGKPKIVMQYIPGAGGLKAANHLYNVAPRDGSVIALLSQAAALVQVMDGRGTRYNAAEFRAIGRMVSTNAIILVRKGAPATSLDAMKNTEVAFATDGKGSQSQYNIVLMGKLLGLKIRIVPGYRGSARIMHAMDQGEIDGYAHSWASFKARRREWIEKEKAVFLAEIGLQGSPDLQVPLLMDLGNDEEQKRMLELVASPTAVGRSFLAPPKTPADRVQALRTAFDTTMTDPEFVAYAKKRNMAMEPMSGVEVQRIIEKTIATPKALLNKVNALVK